MPRVRCLGPDLDGRTRELFRPGQPAAVFVDDVAYDLGCLFGWRA
jgi:hypothetical protein